jgi:RHS repeat-associated protein
VEADPVVADAEAKLGRGDALKALDVAGAGFGEALDGLFGALSLAAAEVSQSSIRYNGPAMLAAQTLAPAFPVFPLAALPSAPATTSTTAFHLAANPHQGVRSSVATWQPGSLPGNSQMALGMPVCLYDSGRRSRDTGKERDSETNLDFFGARYFSGAQGRFTSVDPDQNLGLHLNDPQSWNGYAYAGNNPLLYTDPDGRDYRVCQVDQNGKESNCGVVQDDRAFEDYAKSQGWQVSGGTIYDQSGNTVGAAQWFDGDAMRALIQGTRMAAPGVNLAGQGLLLFGSLAAPLPMAIAQYGAGNGSKSDIAMAMLPEISALYEGGQILKAAATAGKKGAEIVQKAGGVTKAIGEFEALGGTETVKGATRIRTLSDGTKAILYTSSSGAEPTIAIQHASGTVSKFRY